MANLTTAATLTVLASFTLAGCALPQKKLTAGVDDPCASLQSIVKDYPTGFANYRGKPNNFNSVTVYRAKEELIRGHCEVWAWANRDSAYVCSAVSPNEEVADNQYQKAVSYVRECVGSGWSHEEADRVRNDEKAGLMTQFRTGAEGQPNISVHKVDYHGSQSVYVYVGTPSRLEQF